MAGAIVQSGYTVDDSGASSTTIAVTLNGVGAGNHLVVHVGWSSGASTCTVSDGTAYSVGDTKRTDTNQDSHVFYLENVGSGSHTITATLSGSEAFRRIRAYEVSGLATSSSKDQAIGAGSGTPTTSPSSGASSATTNANDFVMGFAQNGSDGDPGATTISAGATYALSGTNNILAVESKSVSATGAQTATFGSTNSKTFSTHVIAFVEAGGVSSAGGALIVRARGPGRGPFPARRFPTFRQGIVSTGVNLTLDIDTPGSITIAGQSVTMTLGVAVSTQGSITVAGQSVGLALGLAVSTPGSITVAGQSITFATNVALSAGSITVAGQSVLMNISVALSAAGGITIQGQAVTTAFSIDLQPGSITINGQDVTMVDSGAPVGSAADEWIIRARRRMRR